MVKVRAGQVWEFEKGANNYERGDRLRILDFDYECEMFDAAPINIVDPSDLYAVTDGFLNECFKFIPQNDLEWLAVNVEYWASGPILGGLRAFKNGSGVSMTAHSEGHECMRGATPYTEQQWQNMRYYLGLDKKPHYRLIKGEWVKQ